MTTVAEQGVLLLWVFIAIGVGVIVGVRLHRANVQALARWRGRTPMADREFSRGCQIPDESFKVDVALAVRRAIADLGTVPAETIRPDDSFSRDLVQLPFWDSLDFLEFVLEVERRLEGKVKLPGSDVIDDLIKGSGGYDAEVRVEHVVRAIVTAVCQPKKPVLDEDW
jgi:acyl carrier protein